MTDDTWKMLDLDGLFVSIRWEVHYHLPGEWHNISDISLAQSIACGVGWIEGNHMGSIVLRSQSLEVPGEEKSKAGGITVIPKRSIMGICDLTKKEHIDIAAFRKEYEVLA